MAEEYSLVDKNLIKVIISLLAEISAKQDAFEDLLAQFLSAEKQIPKEKIIASAKKLTKEAKLGNVKALYSIFGDLPPDIKEFLDRE